MDSLSDLLHAKRPKEPPQLQALRDYVKSTHNVDVYVGTSQFGYTLMVPNAPLASTLRMEIPQIKVACNLDKKLFIRIGHIE